MDGLAENLKRSGAGGKAAEKSEIPLMVLLITWSGWVGRGNSSKVKSPADGFGKSLKRPGWQGQQQQSLKFRE
jgi:hypothetical protein